MAHHHNLSLPVASLRLRSNTILENGHGHVLLGDFCSPEKGTGIGKPFMTSEYYYLQVTLGNIMTLLRSILHAELGIVRKDGKDLSP